MTHTKRYIISTLETALVTFGVAFLAQVETMLNNPSEITASLMISAIAASMIAGTKVAVKLLRETLQGTLK